MVKQNIETNQSFKFYCNIIQILQWDVNTMKLNTLKKPVYSCKLAKCFKLILHITFLKTIEHGNFKSPIRVKINVTL